MLSLQKLTLYLRLTCQRGFLHLIDLVDQLLNENKIRLPHLSCLSVMYEHLRITTEDFTREATQCNCADITHLITRRQTVGSKQFHLYFPLL